MKTMKLLIVYSMVLLLFLVSCDTSTSDVGVYETSREIMINKHDGNKGYEEMRWLTAPMNYEDAAIEDKDSAEEIEEVWKILDSQDWIEKQESLTNPADFRFVTRDNREEKKLETVYYLWRTSNSKNIKLVNEDESLQAQLNESDSEKLYKLLVDRDLADYGISE